MDKTQGLPVVFAGIVSICIVLGLSMILAVFAIVGIVPHETIAGSGSLQTLLGLTLVGTVLVCAGVGMIMHKVEIKKYE